MIADESRFETDPDALVGGSVELPPGWRLGVPDGADERDVTRLTQLLRTHEEHGRGWAGAGAEDVLVEIAGPGLRTRANVVVRDESGRIRAWGSVHDRAGGRMLLVHVVDRDLEAPAADVCSDVLVAWAVAQARRVGTARGLAVQQVDTGAFAEDARQHAWLDAAGFTRVRTWLQQTRPVRAEESALVPDPAYWERDGVRFRAVRRAEDGMPDVGDLREVHAVLEDAFGDHFNSREETFEEFLDRLREDPGHRWDHWWLAELVGEDPGAEPEPVGALVGTVSESADGPDGSYVAYIGVLGAARGRGVAKGLLRTVIADAAARGRDRVGLEVDADSPTGAAGLYASMGWETSYVTESWHRDVPLA